MELMDAWHNLHFLRPHWLWLLPVVLAALWWLQRRFRHRDGWSAVVDAHLLPAIRVQQGGKASGLLRLAMAVFVLAVLALAGPSWHKKALPVVKNQHALVIALDLSRSMLAKDVKPNRLQRAKFKVEDLLQQRRDGQTALLAWAGEAFVVTPLTDDTRTIAAMLDALDPSIMPAQGSRASKALQKAAELVHQAGLRRGDILLITDGVDNPAAREKAAELAKQGFHVHVIGVGTPEGAPIPTRRGFYTDRRGNVVIPKLDEAALQAVAEAGNGHYHRLTADDTDLRAVLGTMTETGNQNEENRMQKDQRSEQWVDDGIWLVLAMLPLMALLYRRGWLLAVLLVIGLQTSPQPAMAQSSPQPPSAPAAGAANNQAQEPSSRWRQLWQNLWYNKNQQAARALRQGQAKTAAQLARDPRWQAAAKYKSGQYQQAEKGWQQLQEPSADDWYNRGNALARAGKLKEALKAYEQALALQPDHADAAYNKKLVEEALKKQQQQKQNKQGQKDQQNKQGQQGQKDQQNQQGQQNQQDQQGQQGQKDQQNQQGQQGQKDQQNQQGQQGQQGQKDQQNQQGQQDQKNQQGKNGQSEEETGKPPTESAAEQEQKAREMEAEQRQAEEKARRQQAAGAAGEKKKDSSDQPPNGQALQPVESAEEAEKQQAMEQWLRRIPDDPGGLLRRKFQYQYRQRQLNRETDRTQQEQDW